MPRLVATDGPGRGGAWPLPDHAIVLGRDPENGIYVNDGRASRHHAELRPGDGGWVLADCGSRNGTWHNGARIDGSVALRPGDRIEIGRTVLVFDPLNAGSVSLGPSDSKIEEPGDDSTSVLSVPVAGHTSAFLRLDEQSLDTARDPLARLQLIYTFSDRLRGCLEMERLAGILLDTIADVIRPDRAALLLRDEKSGEMVPFASRARTGDLAPPAGLQVSRTVVRRALKELSAIVITDTSLDEMAADSKSILFGRIGSVVCVPLVSGEDVHGVLYMDVISRPRDFPRHTLELLGGIASQAAMALGNCLHHRRELASRDVRMQLDVANRIHDALLPLEHFETETVEAHAFSHPSARIGGDYHGVFPTPAGPLFAISDGTGHGIGAAMIMTTARAYLKAVLSCTDLPPAGIMSSLNSLLCEDLEPGLFVSSLLMRIEDGGRRLSYVMAGHEPPLLYRAAEDRFIELETGGLVLGLSPGQFYGDAESVELRPGDRLLLYTDGATEQVNAAGEEFGIDRLRNALRECAMRTPRETLDRIADMIDGWRGEIEQGDDVTAMVIAVR